MAAILELADLTPFIDVEPALGAAMIDDALAMAAKVAPCLNDPDFKHTAAAKAILRRAVLRWDAAGVAGTVTNESVGPISHTVNAGPSRGLFWPSEISELQDLCRDGAAGGAFTIRPRSSAPLIHGEICSIRWGGACSCGSDLNRFEGPLFEGGL